jgi:hypothetical protein
VSFLSFGAILQLFLTARLFSISTQLRLSIHRAISQQRTTFEVKNNDKCHEITEQEIPVIFHYVTHTPVSVIYSN